MLSRLPASAWIMIAALACGTGVGIQAWQAWMHWSGWRAQPPLRTLSTPQKKRVQPETIVSRHLFGQVATTPSAEPVVQENLPETHLRLTLRGVADGSDSGIEGALIEGEDRRTEFYRIGESLPGGALLKDVRPDSVVLDRSGRLETLSFPESRAGSQDIDIVASQPARASGAEALPPPEVVAQDPDALETLPASASQAMPVIDEKRRAEIREKLRKLKEQIQAQSR